MLAAVRAIARSRFLEARAGLGGPAAEPRHVRPMRGCPMALPIQRVVPALRIMNYQRSKAFYVDQLGFRIDWEHRFEAHFPVFMAVVRDGMQIYLSEHTGDCQVGGLVHFVIEDVGAWYGEFTARGVQVTEAPNNDLGFLNMTVTDPDGNQLRFMEPSTETA